MLIMKLLPWGDSNKVTPTPRLLYRKLYAIRAE